MNIKAKLAVALMLAVFVVPGISFAQSTSVESTADLQAEIAAIHANTEEFTLTNWEQILALYDLLAEKQPTAVVFLRM